MPIATRTPAEARILDAFARSTAFRELAEEEARAQEAERRRLAAERAEAIAKRDQLTIALSADHEKLGPRLEAARAAVRKLEAEACAIDARRADALGLDSVASHAERRIRESLMPAPVRDLVAELSAMVEQARGRDMSVELSDGTRRAYPAIKIASTRDVGRKSWTGAQDIVVHSNGLAIGRRVEVISRELLPEARALAYADVDLAALGAAAEAIRARVPAIEMEKTGRLRRMDGGHAVAVEDPAETIGAAPAVARAGATAEPNLPGM